MRSVAQNRTDIELLKYFIKMEQTSLFDETATDVYAVLGNVYSHFEIQLAKKCSLKELENKISQYAPDFKDREKYANSMDNHRNFISYTNALKFAKKHPELSLGNGLSKIELREIALKHNIGLDAIIVNVFYYEHIQDLDYFYEDTGIANEYPKTELKGKEIFDVVIVNQCRAWLAYVYTPKNEKEYFESNIIEDFKSRVR